MILWHPAHAGFARCRSMRSRTDVPAVALGFSSRFGTFGGGVGGGVPNRFSRIHFPLITGDVRFALDVTSRRLPCPNNPRRASLGTITRRKSGPYTLGMP